MKETPVAYEEASRFSFAETVDRARQKLAEEGFGILCEIDVQATLKKKLGVDRAPYLILGACHPPTAHQVLEAEPQVGVLLPCNVTVSEEGGQVIVRAMRPAGALAALHRPDLAPAAQHVGELLQRVVSAACGSEGSRGSE
ncbi:MAG: DUF302 domain-containing protein [Thermoanaerobaculum sp.]|nr:DUF302 domain-containing protein [Thermoanaerobaculum sp.]